MSSLSAALDALNRSGVPYRHRKGPDPTEDTTELDIWLDPSHVDAADAALQRAGWRHLKAPATDHRFYVGFDGGRFLKLDAKLEGTAKTRSGRFAGRLPLGLRRMGPVVAVLGPDGSGKGSTIGALASAIPVAVRVVYLGRRKRSGDNGRAASPPGSPSAAPARAGVVREALFVGRRALVVWGRLALAYAAAWRGQIVLCDRHPIELLATRPRRTKPGAALERLLLVRMPPWPDAVIVLDAPAEVLYDRKPEHPVEKLEAWRRNYLDVFPVRGAVVVPTDAPPQDSVARAAEVVWDALRARRGW